MTSETVALARQIVDLNDAATSVREGDEAAQIADVQIAAIAVVMAESILKQAKLALVSAAVILLAFLMATMAPVRMAEGHTRGRRRRTAVVTELYDHRL